MARTVSIGRQDFEKMRLRNNFYIDKTHFIREWWNADDDVTLITRPRRFGKTLNMSMLEKFFSIEYAGRSELFEGLSIWEDEYFRNLQGTYPVIFLSFADVKETSFIQARKAICHILEEVYNRCEFLLEADLLNGKERDNYAKISVDMEDHEAAFSVKQLSGYLSRYYGKKVIILLDEYDTPIQEAYVYGYWKEMAAFTRGLFNATFKTNPYLERAIMTGVTRVGKESIFSDLNNLEVVTATVEKYADCFGFTEKEVFQALDEYGLSAKKNEVKSWYDGFRFGPVSDIYNPWSILNFLDKKRVGPYWANTSSNSLVGKLLQEGEPAIKMRMERLLQGESFQTILDEQIVFDQLGQGEAAVWSLFLASGYLTAEDAQFNPLRRKMEYVLRLTNLEVLIMFEQMIEGWFQRCRMVNNAFLQALLGGDVEAMNLYMNRIALQTFSYFDTGKAPSQEESERFYHGFVLGLMVELADRYVLTSNRESGFGRYDVMLEPKNSKDNSIILEFKVQEPSNEAALSDTVAAALKQIEEKRYEAALQNRGIPSGRIRKYGFAFRGKEVLIGAGEGA